MDYWILVDGGGVNPRTEEGLPCDRHLPHFPCQISQNSTKEVTKRMIGCDLLMRTVSDFDQGSEAQVGNQVNVVLLRDERALRIADDHTTAVMLVEALAVKG